VAYAAYRDTYSPMVYASGVVSHDMVWLYHREGGDRGGNQYGPQRKHGAAVVLTSNRRIATGRSLRVHCLLRCSV